MKKNSSNWQKYEETYKKSKWQKFFFKKWEAHYESFENMYYTHIYSTSLHNFKVQGN